MSEEKYHKLVEVLNTLPNGFPSTENGIEIKILKKIFTLEDINLFCDLRLTFETPEEIAKRTGRKLEGLEEKLISMQNKGQLFMVDFGDARIFKMIPWVFGIYEFQLKRMDKELAKLCEEYAPIYAKQFFSNTPQLMQTLPIEKEISSIQEALPYERVSTLIESSESFMVMDCICKKEKGMLGKPCDRPTEICMAFAPVPGVFENNHMGGRTIEKDEAKALLNKAEEAGLVHLTNNFQNGRFFICNCCKCCCGVLRSINELKIPASTVVNSHYYAVIDSDACTACGVCADERCQVNSIEENGSSYKVVKENCIGCGLCVSTCPEEAIQMKKKKKNEHVPPPDDETRWYKARGEKRGVDFSKYE